MWCQSNLCTKCVDHTSVAEHHQQQWQLVVDHGIENSSEFQSDIAHVGGVPHANALLDTSRKSDVCSLECWHKDPDEHDWSIDKTLSLVHLHNTYRPNVLSTCITLLQCRSVVRTTTQVNEKKPEDPPPYIQRTKSQSRAALFALNWVWIMLHLIVTLNVVTFCYAREGNDRLSMSHTQTKLPNFQLFIVTLIFLTIYHCWLY